MQPPAIIETSRLRLRVPVMEDAVPIFEQYGQDPDVTKFLSWPPHQSLADTSEFIKRCLTVWENGSAFPWAMTRKDDHRLLGMIELRLRDHKADVGYVLARAYWNKGYATEATKAVVAWALAQKEIYRVWAVCDVENLASARVLEKVGMAREGVLRRWLSHPNCGEAPRDCYCYSIIK
ncbi:MAG: GNAT family N-acetyltransferase [candidate division KSB1 bacterium]|nr:GNAT family N-acetyltransferase [candidate division KSB1 bacterium]MDZ7368040.1 GNAT family N-acetyltransferase [candidate division KSB1 bacterium]MDZ7405663.1 GNAT family N-acetyltransferase [candidate division KSB1 bacterium]